MAALVAVALVCVLAGCAEAGKPVGVPGERVEVTTLAMDAAGSAPGAYAAVSESPVHLGAFTSWYGRGADAEDFDEVA